MRSWLPWLLALVPATCVLCAGLAWGRRGEPLERCQQRLEVYEDCMTAKDGRCPEDTELRPRELEEIILEMRALHQSMDYLELRLLDAREAWERIESSDEHSFNAGCWWVRVEEGALTVHDGYGEPETWKPAGRARKLVTANEKVQQVEPGTVLSMAPCPR